MIYLVLAGIGRAWETVAVSKREINPLVLAFLREQMEHPLITTSAKEALAKIADAKKPKKASQT